MQQLHGVIHIDTDNQRIIGFRDVRDDEFWCSGHFPVRPVLPGVLLVETLAQLCAFYWRKEAVGPEIGSREMLFGGIDRVKFRDAILPPSRVIIAAHMTTFRPRRSRFDTQAWVDGSMVFEGEITGILGPDLSEL